MKKITLFTLLFVAILNSCTNDSPDDLLIPIEKVNYNTHIKPIVDSRCTSCHNDSPNAFGPMPLQTYAQVVEAVENRKLINKISSDNPDNGQRMPFGGPILNQNTIEIFEQWVEDGLLENNN